MYNANRIVTSSEPMPSVSVTVHILYMPLFLRIRNAVYFMAVEIHLSILWAMQRLHNLTLGVFIYSINILHMLSKVLHMFLSKILHMLHWQL